MSTLNPSFLTSAAKKLENMDIDQIELTMEQGKAIFKTISEEDCRVGYSFSDQSLKKVWSCADYNAIACQEAITKILDPVHKRK